MVQQSLTRPLGSATWAGLAATLAVLFVALSLSYRLYASLTAGPIIAPRVGFQEIAIRLTAITEPDRVGWFRTFSAGKGLPDSERKGEHLVVIIAAKLPYFARERAKWLLSQRLWLKRMCLQKARTVLVQ